MCVKNLSIENVNMHLGNGSLHCLPLCSSSHVISLHLRQWCFKDNLVGFGFGFAGLAEFGQEWQGKYDAGGGARR